MKSEARAAGLDRVRVVSHPPAEGFYRTVGAHPTGTVSANPPAVAWDRPELEWRPIGPADRDGAVGLALPRPRGLRTETRVGQRPAPDRCPGPR